MTHDVVSLRWDDPADDSITSYQVLRRDADADDPGVFSVHVDDTGSADNSYVDRAVQPETRYVYRIRARNAAGLSEQSSYFNAHTLAAPAEESNQQPTSESTPELALGPIGQTTAKSADDPPVSCPDPTPTAVAFEAVPIVVDSTTDDYFVLYVKHDVDGETVELPALVKKGEAGTTTLAENVEALPKERYRVEKYLISDPADVDGDCIDDLTELDNLGSMNPVNPPAAIDSSDGALAIPNQQTFETFANRGFVKFVVFDIDTDRPGLYFLNTKTYHGHSAFLAAIGLGGIREGMRAGTIAYNPELIAPNGIPGVYYYSVSLQLHPQYRFEPATVFHTLLAASVPLLKDNLALHIQNGELLYGQSSLALLRESRIPLVFDEDIHAGTNFVALNPAEGYGLLRVLGPGQRPNPRDVVLYATLPNELPRVAGIITTVPQAPLSHVNLRAVQDGVPNAFIRNALDDDDIAALVGSYVHYTVIKHRYTIRAATRTEVDDHHAASRPAATQTPQRDLTVTTIKPLSQIGFDDWNAFGVKAANLAELRKLGLPSGTVPDGFAIPFYFYDEFMKHNDFYTRIRAMLADSNFQGDINNAQEKQLKELRDAIEEAETPQWIIDALVEMNEGFASGINRRYRSSTNNEDLPGFNGAGLYDSKSQKPSEDEDDLAKSLKEVYASLWNFRAFIERDFHRVDHLKAAMGILVHPSYQDELVNGVAVSFDPVTGRAGSYYVNSQLGEDLVTNPDAHSVPEEVLLRSLNSFTILRTSNQLPPGELLMSRDQLDQLRRSLTTIDNHFEGLYNPAAGQPFAIEIEFKITSDDILAIKQARPWVFPKVIVEVEVEVDVEVEVEQVNDAPQFPAGPIEREVAKDAKKGDKVGRPVTATDDDGDRLTYRFIGSSFPFEIDTSSGQIRVGSVASFDPTVQDTYTVTVEARDPDLASDDTQVTIRVVDQVTTRTTTTGGGGRGGGGGGPPPIPIPSDEEFDWNVTRDIESLHRDNDLPTGLWSNGEVLWVVQNSATGVDFLFAYDLNTGERLEQHEFELERRNRFSHGIWSDGEIVWLADSGQDMLFAYSLATSERDEQRDLVLDERNRDPRGIWSDGELMLVLDSVKDALFAYDLDSGRLLAEFPLDKLNKSPRGIWSDSFTIWVSDDGAKRIFAYRIERETLNRYEDQEFTFRSLLKAGNGEARGIWSDGDVIFVADEQDDHVYTYNLPDAIDARLASLTLSGVEFGEFSARQTDYAAVVDAGLPTTTVEAEAAQAKAKVVILPADADVDPENGHQAELIDGQDITVAVTSEDGSRTLIYRVAISHCLSGLSEARLSLAQFVGGSVSELVDCARSHGVDALYHNRNGVWTAYFLEAPEFLSHPFRTRFAEGVPAGEVVIANREFIPITTPAVPSPN